MPVYLSFVYAVAYHSRNKRDGVGHRWDKPPSPKRKHHFTIYKFRVTCILYRIISDTSVNPTVESSEKETPGDWFAIGMETNLDRALCLVGKDETQAMRLFRTITWLSVIPCTLHDIATDMGF